MKHKIDDNIINIFEKLKYVQSAKLLSLYKYKYTLNIIIVYTKKLVF